MPDIKTAQTATYDQGSVKITWRKGHDESTLEGVKRTLIAVNQVGLVLSHALEKPRNPSAKTQAMEKVGYVTLQRLNSSSDGSKQRRSPHKAFTLWIIASDSTSTSPRTLLAVHVGRVSDRAVHIVSDALVKTTTPKGNISDIAVVILDTYIPQTYVSSAQPESRLYLDTPPVRFLKAKNTSSIAPSEGIDKFESPNYMTGISARLLASSVRHLNTPETLSLTRFPYRPRYPATVFSSSCRNLSTDAPSSTPSLLRQASNPQPIN